GAPGILAVSGPNVIPGYTEAERDAGTFADGWLLTGDIGQVGADGRVFITGRAKDVIVRSGHNIDPRLIEDALMQHPAVLLAAAVGEPDEYAGELPVAFVVLKDGAAADAQELMAFANKLIPERPAYPKRLEFVPSLPQTAVGKIFKPALREAAVLRALAERLDRAGLGAQVTPQTREEGGRSTIVFTTTVQGADAQGAAEAVQRMMVPFAIRYRIEQATA
ncbi:MAG: acyl-CoA synthetase, partial [Comamonadaceae bacterium]